MTVYILLFSSPSFFDDILKEKLEIAMYIIIVSEKHQIIQQYKKQLKKSNKICFWWRQQFWWRHQYEL